MPDLAFFDQALHGSCDILDRHLRIDTMLVEQIDTVDAQATDRVLGDFANVGGLAVETVRSRLEVVADGLCSYCAATKEIGNADRHEVGRRLNNWAENSHQPFRRRERAMQRI